MVFVVSLWLLSIWECGEHLINFSDSHFYSGEKIHCVKSVHIRRFFWSVLGHFSRSDCFWCFQSIQKVQSFSFNCLKEQVNYCFLHSTKSSRNHWGLLILVILSLSLLRNLFPPSLQLWSSFWSSSRWSSFWSSSLQPSQLVDILWLGKIGISLSARSSEVFGIGVTTRISAMRSTTYVLFSFEASVLSSFDFDINVGASVFWLVLRTDSLALNRIKGTVKRACFKVSSKLITGKAFRKLQL